MNPFADQNPYESPVMAELAPVAKRRLPWRTAVRTTAWYAWLTVRVALTIAACLFGAAIIHVLIYG